MKAMMSETDERHMWYWQISEDENRAARDEREAEQEARRILDETEPAGRVAWHDRLAIQPCDGNARCTLRDALAESLAAFVAMSEADAFGEVGK